MITEVDPAIIKLKEAKEKYNQQLEQVKITLDIKNKEIAYLKSVIQKQALDLKLVANA